MQTRLAGWWSILSTCIKTKKISVTHISIYTMIGTIAAAMGQGWDNKCEVVGQGSHASLTGFCFSAVACVHKILW